ncbi:S9 family peptidase [Sediminitomix flava]|uniref:Dipeptidyl-peptidase-4 n=1 Tax=Sediminitomix flava TaxID=379075 RepID=A0A315ZAT3_SEDFL|nr:DPP IV N-terminal domain-containing protein [Sediminitomix flava]PWJ42259.1 dipeptidyl-peptidase-4 [Sediminitomix flava]
MRKLISTLSLLLLVGVAFAQDKTLTLDEAVIKNGAFLYPEYQRGINFRNGNTAYTKIEGDDLVEYAVKGEHSKTLIYLSDLGASHATLKGMQYIPAYNWVDDNKIAFLSKGNAYVYDVTTKKSEQVTAMPEEALNTEWAPSYDYVAYTVGNNLFVAGNGANSQVTNDTEKGIVNGQVVHRNEFGVHKGIFWSPSGESLAFYRKDETMVTEYPLVNTGVFPAKEEPVYYPFAGMPSHEVTLGVYNIKNDETVFIKTGEPKDQYLTNIAWDPSEEYIYIVVLNRAQNHAKLNKYNAKTGDFIKTILEEKDDVYLQVHHPMTFIDGKDEFLWRSERNGFEHIYRYTTDGKLLNQVTDGAWDVIEFVGFDERNRKAYVVGTANNGLERQVYVADIRKGITQKVTKSTGTYEVVDFDPKSQQFIVRFSSLDVPNRYEILDVKGTDIKTIHDAKNPFEGYTVSPIELSALQSENGRVLNTRMIKPADFDPSKKYPVLVYVYGGPGVQLIQNKWGAGASTWMQYMAQQGYIIFTLDNRGTANRGKAFKHDTHLTLGTEEVKDQLVGVEYLKSLPYVDADRMAVHGWSFGGFMTTSLMLKQPDVFKVGVAGGPVIDWKMYEIMYTERYMSTPQENPEGYATANLLDKAQNLKGDLLMIHGADDDVVVWQHSLEFVRSCVTAGVQMDYFVYPGHKHNVRGVDRIHLMRKILDYVMEKMPEETK